MRTTLTLDDDLAGLLKRRARALGVPFKEAVNRALRAGLDEAATAKRGTAPKTIPHSFGFKPGIDLDKLNQLADELEAEAFAASRSVSDLAARSHPTLSRAPSREGSGATEGSLTQPTPTAGPRRARDSTRRQRPRARP